MVDPTVHASSLERLIVVPRNGYVNRLQAWASSAVLAAQFDVALEVAWDTEPMAPASAEDLFARSQPGTTFLSEQQLRERIGLDHRSLDRYVTVDRGRRLVTLAGHDRGEQALMADLLAALHDPCAPTTLLIIAGGKFHLPQATSFAQQRKLFYARLAWSDAVRRRTDEAMQDRSPFLGLHIRGTDRSMQAPTPRAIHSALGELAEREQLASVFIAADTTTSLGHWTAEATRMGLEPWSLPEPDLDRATANAGIDAVVDWRILSKARGMVFSAESSFGEEAAVAGGIVDSSFPLRASDTRQRVRRAGAFGRAAVTYPRRRWGQGRNPS